MDSSCSQCQFSIQLTTLFSFYAIGTRTPIMILQNCCMNGTAFVLRAFLMFYGWYNQLNSKGTTENVLQCSDHHLNKLIIRWWCCLCQKLNFERKFNWACVECLNRCAKKCILLWDYLFGCICIWMQNINNNDWSRNAVCKQMFCILWLTFNVSRLMDWTNTLLYNVCI